MNHPVPPTTVSAAAAALALALCAGPMGAHAAEGEDEEPVEIESYSVGGSESRADRPSFKPERPKLQTGISMDAFKPRFSPPTVEMKLDSATFDEAVRVGPTEATARDQQRSPPAAADSSPPAEQVDAGARPGASSGGSGQGPSQRGSGSGPSGSGSANSAGADVEIVPVDLTSPTYPREAFMDRTEGHVTVEFVIGRDGSVQEATVVESEPRGVFDREALRAVNRWRFQPVMVDGQRTEYRIRHTIDFTMD